MRNALHEQLLKAGLIDEKRLEESEREKKRRDQPAQPRQGGQPQGGKGRARHGKGQGQGQGHGGPQHAQRNGGPRQPAGDSRNRPQPRAVQASANNPPRQDATTTQSDATAKPNAQAERRALEREIVRIIKANRHPHNDGDEVFNFVDGRKVGRIYCTAETGKRLTAGELAIVRLRTRYAVVPTATAAGIAAKAPEFVLVANPQSDTPEAVAPAYAEHPIPDDLRW
ncbi:MAG: DUF2058 domain-containing protein [Gammaproteobacteria bacterium]|nr:DUF2058 domain-containing protein [Gammaproteobacteria bacterium]